MVMLWQSANLKFKRKTHKKEYLYPLKKYLKQYLYEMTEKYMYIFYNKILDNLNFASFCGRLEIFIIYFLLLGRVSIEPTVPLNEIIIYFRY